MKSRQELPACIQAYVRSVMSRCVHVFVLVFYCLLCLLLSMTCPGRMVITMLTQQEKAYGGAAAKNETVGGRDGNVKFC